MKRPTQHLFTLTAIAALTLGGITHHADAAVIYNETFSGASTTDLNGTAPDTTTGGNTWVSTTAWNKDGSVDAGTDDSAFLAFTPVAGKVYTLSATLTTPTGLVSDWAAIGFTADDVTNIDFWSGTNLAAPWVLYRTDETDGVDGDAQVVSFLGTGVGGSADEGEHTGPLTLAIELDTTGALWTVEWFVGGASARTQTYGSNPTINYVGLGRIDGASTTFSAFSLTDDSVAIPTPAALPAGLAMLAVIAARRRR